MTKSGSTPLIKVDAFCEKFNLPNLWVKDESKNPFGTWKDRRSEQIIQKVTSEGIDRIAIITFGNAGYSLAEFAKGSQIKVSLIVDILLSESIKEKLRATNQVIIEADLRNNILNSRAIETLAAETLGEKIKDVTNGYHDAYKRIVSELTQEPDLIICPVGSGEAFTGICRGIYERGWKTKVIGIGPEENPSFADKLYTRWTPYAKLIAELRKTKNEFLKLSEEEIYSGYSFAKEHIDCEPSSAVVITALQRLNLPSETFVVAINSGKGLIRDVDTG